MYWIKRLGATTMQIMLGVAGGGCLCFVIVGVLFFGMCSTVAVKTSQEMKRQEAAETITLAKFNQIQNGMTVAQVKAVLGKEGSVQGDTQMPGVAGVVPNIKTVTYSWKCDNGVGNILCMFQNDALISKNQFGLK